MSAASLIYEGQRRRAQERSRRDWNERTRNDPTSRAFQQRAAMEDFRINQMKDAENKRALALQEKSNQGLLGVADRRQIGATKRTGLEQAGMTGRLGMTQAGLDTRDKRSNELERRRLAGQQFKMLQELGASNLGLEKPINYGQRFRDFNTEMLGGQGQGQSQRQYDTLDRAKGMREYYDRGTGKLAYTDLIDPDSRPTKTGLKYLSKQDPTAREAEGMRQISVEGMGDGTMNGQKETNESKSTSPYEGWTNIRPGQGKYSGSYWGTSPTGQIGRVNFEPPVLASGLPNTKFLERADWRKSIGYPQSEEDLNAYQRAKKRLKNINRIGR